MDWDILLLQEFSRAKKAAEGLEWTTSDCHQVYQHLGRHIGGFIVHAKNLMFVADRARYQNEAQGSPVHRFSMKIIFQKPRFCDFDNFLRPFVWF